MTIQIENEYEASMDLDYHTIIEEVVKGALDYVNCPYEAWVNVLLTDDASIHEINLANRQIDAATDVLSFPLITYEEPANFSVVETHPEDYFEPETGELLLGDIVISVDKVYAQSKEYGHSAKRELAFLVAHSMLHLFGYDHMEEEERLEMEAKQEEILQSLHYVRE